MDQQLTENQQEPVQVHAPVVQAAPVVAPHPVIAPVVPVVPKAPGIGKVIKAIAAYTLGGVHVVELKFTDNTEHFIKWKSGALETGGTHEWGTGVKS